MKKLRVTLNDKVFEVLVEVLEDDESRYPGATGNLPSGPGPETAPIVRQAAPSAPVRKESPTGGGGAVFAPIVGTVNRILVEPGAPVKENEPLIVLDAMKMDTFINAPRSGVVDQLFCRIGDAVQVGQKLLSLK